MRFKGAADLAVKTAPNSTLFMRNMSNGARELLNDLITWGLKHTALFGTSSRDVMVAFGPRFNQLRFEQAEQKYDTKMFLGLITGIPAGKNKKPGIKVKTPDDVLAALSLDLLFDSTWVHNHPVHMRQRVGDIGQYKEIYDWIVDKFVDCDITGYDLGRISEMGQDGTTVEILKNAANGIEDSKRNVPYLYTVVKGILQRNESAGRKSAAADSQNDLKLAQLGALAVEAPNKIPMKPDPDRKARWERERQFIDALRDLDK